MLVPRLHCAVIAFLWRKKPNDTWIHNHTVTVSTWSHAGRVEKKAYLTPKQTQKNKPTAKQNLLQLQIL
jgi:hypothetical protein